VPHAGSLVREHGPGWERQRLTDLAHPCGQWRDVCPGFCVVRPVGCHGGVLLRGLPWNHATSAESVSDRAGGDASRNVTGKGDQHRNIQHVECQGTGAHRQEQPATLLATSDHGPELRATAARHLSTPISLSRHWLSEVDTLWPKNGPGWPVSGYGHPRHRRTLESDARGGSRDAAVSRVRAGQGPLPPPNARDTPPAHRGRP